MDARNLPGAAKGQEEPVSRGAAGRAGGHLRDSWLSKRGLHHARFEVQTACPSPLLSLACASGALPLLHAAPVCALLDAPTLKGGWRQRWWRGARRWAPCLNRSRRVAASTLQGSWGEPLALAGSASWRLALLHECTGAFAAHIDPAQRRRHTLLHRRRRKRGGRAGWTASEGQQPRPSRQLQGV